jgi:hypothetical protein
LFNRKWVFGTYERRETADETGSEVLVTITELVVLILGFGNADYNQEFG